MGVHAQALILFCVTIPTHQYPCKDREVPTRNYACWAIFVAAEHPPDVLCSSWVEELCSVLACSALVVR